MKTLSRDNSIRNGFISCSCQASQLHDSALPCAHAGSGAIAHRVLCRRNIRHTSNIRVIELNSSMRTDCVLPRAFQINQCARRRIVIELEAQLMRFGIETAHRR
ncbi:SWIM zinc finger family protein [Paraburkholderia bannensis]|uniref:SWIM zinc finger family protein n=1 Tax=Paraburkholderia bannensis TaxID=765414 RepID=UPI0038BC623C